MRGLSDVQWSRLRDLVADKTGLHFPRERSADLLRGVQSAARELGFAEASECVDWLLSASLVSEHIEVLASHLAVGETYFFRDGKVFDALATEILPELIRARRGGGRRLRFWSAACCTGEEPYSLAILLHRLLPDLDEWRVTITASDINGRFLRKAAAGIYGEWSFRDTPAWVRERYFSRTADGGYAILPEIRKLVTFARLNLVEDVYPSLTPQTYAMDVIFCRNVLMYFAPHQVRRVIRNLHHALAEGGWLIVSPSEASHALFPGFVAVNFPGAIFYRKCDAALGAGPPGMETAPVDQDGATLPMLESAARWTAPAPPIGEGQAAALARAEDATAARVQPSPRAVAEALYREGRYHEVVEVVTASLASRLDPQSFSLLARAFANQGKLAEALVWCERWVTVDKLNPAAHYLRAIVLLEQGDMGKARSCLQRALYVQPDFALAHFALGNLARARSRHEDAQRHFSNALRALERHPPGDPLPESEGLTAGRLRETIMAMIDAETAA
jgi:chemotaxis protein methyltransferase CheR